MTQQGKEYLKLTVTKTAMVWKARTRQRISMSKNLGKELDNMCRREQNSDSSVKEIFTRFAEKAETPIKVDLSTTVEDKQENSMRHALSKTEFRVLSSNRMRNVLLKCPFSATELNLYECNFKTSILTPHVGDMSTRTQKLWTSYET